jgi:lipopolysaccharide transport system ATP-binding protein
MLEFAELDEYGDAPVRTYSEGMRLRLAFGMIVLLRPAALIVDEVLAVGDLRFQAKCLNRIAELREEGMTLILASHNLDQVATGCDEAIWLQGGGVRVHADAPTVVEDYRQAMREKTIDLTPPPQPGSSGKLELRRNRFGGQEIRIDNVALSSNTRPVTGEIASGEPLTVSIKLRSEVTPMPQAIVAIAIRRVSDGVICCDSNTGIDATKLGGLDATAEVVLICERLDLTPDKDDIKRASTTPNGNTHTTPTMTPTPSRSPAPLPSRKGSSARHTAGPSSQPHRLIRAHQGGRRPCSHSQCSSRTDSTPTATRQTPTRHIPPRPRNLL